MSAVGRLLVRCQVVFVRTTGGWTDGQARQAGSWLAIAVADSTRSQVEKLPKWTCGNQVSSEGEMGVGVGVGVLCSLPACTSSQADHIRKSVRDARPHARDVSHLTMPAVLIIISIQEKEDRIRTHARPRDGIGHCCAGMRSRSIGQSRPRDRRACEV